jgi:prepilin-type N-terminal cleavage/methylation domain-containing protein
MAVGRTSNPPRFGRAGYTLIELMVVMSIIIVLVSLVFPTVSALKKKRMIAVAQAELKQVETAIQAYKARLGFYPPDNPGNPVTNQLYFELSGTTLTNVGNLDYFVTLDGSSRIGRGDLSVLYGFDASNHPKVSGFANCSTSARGSDEVASAVNFLTGLKPTQLGSMVVNNDVINNALLACSVKWAGTTNVVVTKGNSRAVVAGLNPWRYVSSNPTNNPASYDLWVDLMIGSKTYRVSNWSQQPQVVGAAP